MSALGNLRLRVTEAVAPLANRVDTLLDGLSGRDRKILLAMVSLTALLLVGVGGWWMGRTLDRQEELLASRLDTLRFIQEEQADLAAAQARQAELEAELAQYADTDLSAFMSQGARQAAMSEQLASVRETSTLSLGRLVQRNYSVSISKVTLGQFASFLYNVEGKGYPLRITSASLKEVRKRPDDPEKQITVKLEVAAFELAPEEP